LTGSVQVVALSFDSNKEGRFEDLVELTVSHEDSFSFWIVFDVAGAS
jgi:hypothetical protein